MRSGGGYAVQQALGAETAGAVREAASLARRRGDARVTPLHVASAMLSAPAGLLRAACIQSHSQCSLQQHEALELRLSAALGRLPMAWPTAAAMSFHHHAPPLALSNALIAALKRASARQRSRGGSMDGGPRQQSAALGAVKDVEIEQLVISILDDPSVDRAMREAGFSSSQVKTNVEKISAATASLEQSGGGTTSPNPIRVYKKARAGGQPSHGETDLELLHRPVVVVDPERSLALSLMGYHSGDRASEAKQRSPGRPEQLVGGTELVTTTTATASLPPWLRRCQDPTFLSTSLNPISTSFCTQAATCHRPKFTELTVENLKIMCNALELRIRHRRHKADHVAAGVATAVLWCRSGMTMRRRRSPATTSSSSPATTSCWLLFHGEDVSAKKAVAEELTSLVFGSGAELASFTLTASSMASSGSLRRKRSRDDGDGYDVVGVRRLLFEAIVENPHCVVWIDGVEQLDHESEIAIRNVIVEGRIAGCDDGGVVSLEDAVVVLSSNQCRGEGERSRSMEKGAKSRCFNFDLNTCEEEEEDSVDDVGIMNVVDGVFSFD